MTTVIVPLDFSETSFNAAHYAAAMFADKPATTIVLYHYYASVDEVATANQFLTSLSRQLSDTGLKVETELETGDNFIDRLSAFSHVKRAYMIVMGLTGKTP
ncbi:MAG: hypothetical protein ABIW38_01165, partial [Ferruginibacter sp.]